ncbi:Uncharacterised protein [Moraxella lacunata]|uniref:Uncharacterized protein n=1 Tax=Moraxella lacunata TaxID=477 RepID=A0A378TQY9_MORLA|nr:hypothetical protein [Moraxella lacunata]STZ63218.1 Uncharacterised protein [Moraxella lacunata]
MKKHLRDTVVLLVFIGIMYLNNNYKTYILLAIYFLMILILCGLLKYAVKKDWEFNNIAKNAIIIFLALFFVLPNSIANHITKYFVAKNQSKICGIVSQINKPSLGHNTFNLENNASNFKLNIYDNLSIGDKVCVTYNPNEKWYGYAYVFKLDKL